MIATTTSTTSRSKQFRVEVYSQDHGIVSQPAQDCRTGPRCSLARCDLLLHHLADLVDTSQLRGSIDDAASQRLVYSCSDPSTNFGTSIEHTVQPCGRHTLHDLPARWTGNCRIRSRHYCYGCSAHAACYSGLHIVMEGQGDGECLCRRLLDAEWTLDAGLCNRDDELDGGGVGWRASHRVGQLG